MNLCGLSFFKKYLLPGFVFQSVVIAGGYGTGREIIEYFLNYGPLGGLLGMVLVTTVVWSVILAASFEFARVFRAYDYRTFSQSLLGRGWFLFEALYLVAMFLVIAVVGSAAGVLMRDNFGMPYMAGAALMFVSIGCLTFGGRKLIEKFLASWSIVLYLLYAVILVAAITKFGPVIHENFATLEIRAGWLVGGLKYALYNLICIPAVLFCLSHIETRKQAICSGLLSGVIGIVPALLFFISVVSQYPAVLPEELPMVRMLESIGSTFLLVIFQVVLLGTLVESGTGFIHAYNERLRSFFRAKGKNFPRILRPVVAATVLLISLAVSSFGLINLIARGYGGLSWGFLFIFVVPLFSVGIYRIARNR